MAQTTRRTFSAPIQEIASETPSVFSVRLVAPADFSFEPGQYVQVRQDGVTDPRGPARSFSLSSSPTELPTLQFTTRAGPSPFKQSLHGRSVGQPLEISGPIGAFRLDTTRDALLVAGGIGVTPFRSMLRWSVDTSTGRRIVLLHSVVSPADSPFAAELHELAQREERVRIEYTVTGDPNASPSWAGRRGRVSAETLREVLAELDHPKAYVSGPPLMVRGVRELLTADVRFPAADLRLESFSGY